jgi:site-specific DNA recombinase
VRSDVYTRLSRDRDEQTSTTRQAQDCRRLIEAKGWELAEVHEDVDFSAYRNVRRPAYERLEAKVRAREIDAVVVWKIDRLARSLKEFLRFAELCERNGVALVSVHEPFDTSSPIGRAIMQVLAVFAELESATIGIRVRSARDYAAVNGKPKAGGHRAFGYERDMTQRLSEAVAVRQAVDRVLHGESFTTIAKEWNAQPLPTVGGAIGKWSTATVARTLRSAHLAGLRVHRGEIAGEGTWEPIITRAEHEALQRPRSANKRAQRSYLLTGVLFCGRCGTRMTGRTYKANERARRTYYCAPHPSYGGCGGQIAADPLDELVTDAVLAAAGTPEVQATLAGARDDSRVAETIAALQSVELRFQELGEDYAAGRVPRAAFLAAMAKLEQDQRQLQRALDEHGSSSLLVGTGDRVADAWAERDLTWRSALVAAVLDRIVVQPVGRGRQVPVEDRVELHPRA